ncbi:MAG: 2-pyrone-4,6-dicarboxylate hydrolase [Rhodoferax sp.]|nr:2-pyrone-4,6-dicarboxylate hydrolase [Rhodoferax sp.]
MNLLDLPKIDGHCHVLDPARFAFSAEAAYHPAGQELGTAAYFKEVMAAYGTRHALLVGPNSGYASDNRCLLDAIAQGEGRFKGVAVLPADTGRDRLRDLQRQGIVGVAFNPALHGLAHYADIDGLLQRLAALNLWAQFQVSGDQLAELLPRIERARVRTLIDHCGRPVLADGPDAPGVRALRTLADSGLGVVKLSGFAKFSQTGYPFEDAREPVLRLLQAFGPERCIWASDWPFLRAPYRLDYGTLLQLAGRWFTPDQCRTLMWDAPARLFEW